MHKTRKKKSKNTFEPLITWYNVCNPSILVALMYFSIFGISPNAVPFAVSEFSLGFLLFLLASSFATCFVFDSFVVVLESFPTMYGKHVHKSMLRSKFEKCHFHKPIFSSFVSFLTELFSVFLSFSVPSTFFASTYFPERNKMRKIVLVLNRQFLISNNLNPNQNMRVNFKCFYHFDVILTLSST